MVALGESAVTEYVLLAAYTAIVIAVTFAITKRAAYSKGYRDGKRFERLTYSASWGTAIDAMEDDE